MLVRYLRKALSALANVLRHPSLVPEAMHAYRTHGIGKTKHVLLGKDARRRRIVGKLLDEGRQRRAMLLPHPLLHEAKQEPYGTAATGERPRVFAYYHPAFYQTPFNDQAWGEGFTEWTSVLSGASRFAGHYQPRIPLNYDLYDQSDASTIQRQIALAKSSGITGMIFYSYFSDGEVRFEKPLAHFRAEGEMPWLTMWCNHHWTKRWDASEDEVLWRQGYESDELLVDYFSEMFSDPMYERMHGRPLLIIFAGYAIPGRATRIARWRALFAARHQENPIILAADGDMDEAQALKFGFDGLAGHSDHQLWAQQEAVVVKGFNSSFAGTYVSYTENQERQLARVRHSSRLIAGVLPGFDNDARYNNCGKGLIGSTPALYESHLLELCKLAQDAPFLGGNPYVFINAWNEWAECAYLEPDLHYGYAYLNATSRAIARATRT